MRPEFDIKGVGVKSREEWDKITQQLFPIWQKNGGNKGDENPSVPGFDLFQKAGTTEGDAKIKDEWERLEKWIYRNGCTLQGNAKVALWPQPCRKSPKVNPDAPYEGDVLKRNEKIGAMLSQLISIPQEPLVLAINGAWGSGKTTLLNMWIPVAEKEFSVVHFNAWETDYAKDPLVALVAELKDSLCKTVPDEKMRDLLRAGANVAVKVLSGGLLSAPDFSTAEMKEARQKFIEEQLSEYEGAKKLLENFRNRLEEIAAGLKKKPLIFVIDELDRCRPTYAIELLERIKHLFTVKGVCFVLALDKRQLSEAIKAVYGNIHTEGYLRRFIDLTYNLSEIKPDDYIRLLFHETHLADYLRARSINDGAEEWTQDILCYLAPIFGFSLRDIEHVVRQISLAARSTGHNFLFSPLILTTMACIKYYDESLYRKFYSGEIGADDVLKILPVLTKEATHKASGHLCVQAALRYIDQTAHWNVWVHTLELEEGPESGKEDRKDLAHIIQSLNQWHDTSFHISTKELCKWIYEKLELLHPLVG